MSRRPVLHLRLASERSGAHQILVRPEPFGIGIDVQVLPPPDGVGHDRGFFTYVEGRAYANGLSAATGWPVVDQCDAADGPI